MKASTRTAAKLLVTAISVLHLKIQVFIQLSQRYLVTTTQSLGSLNFCNNLLEVLQVCRPKLQTPLILAVSLGAAKKKSPLCTAPLSYMQTNFLNRSQPSMSSQVLPASSKFRFSRLTPIDRIRIRISMTASDPIKSGDLV